MITMVNNKIQCNHTFCTLGGKHKDAAYKVTQVWPNGNESVTYVCESDMYAMRSVLKDTDIVINL